LSDLGGAALVETTTIDLGRDPVALLRISEASGLHIVMSTGWYRQRWYPPGIEAVPVEELAAKMINDIETGTSDESIRAGVIGEIGFEDEHPTPAERHVLEGVAVAQISTGAAIITHASRAPAGRQQLQILESASVDPARVVIGHADTYLDREYHLDLLARGAWLAFDTVGREHMNTDASRAWHLVELIDSGWAGRLLLSSDRCYRSDLRRSGGAGYGVVLGPFFERLRSLGIGQADLDTLTIANPGAVLAF
jgi:phosphotriesterase-related protein